MSVTPTLDTRYCLDRHLDDPEIPEVMRARAKATAHDRSDAFRNALEAGVTVTDGTDSGTTFVPHGALPTKIRLMHEGGLSPRQAVASARWLAAAEVGPPEVIGTLAVGAEADLLVLNADPTPGRLCAREHRRCASGRASLWSARSVRSRVEAPRGQRVVEALSLFGGWFRFRVVPSTPRTPALRVPPDLVRPAPAT